MAAPNHVDHHQPAAGASSSDSPKVGGHEPSVVSPDDRNPTRLLGMPMAAPNQVDQPQAAAAAAAAAAGASVSSATAGHCPGVAPDGDDLTLTLTKQFATATLETAAAAAVANNKSSPGVSESSPPIRASLDTPPAAAAAKPAGSRAERRARRRTRLHLIRVPTDYLRAGQESRDRSRRRELVRRCVGKLFDVHEDRASERGISAMMARLTTTLKSASVGGGDAAVSAAASSPEHAGLADLLEKMALSKKR
ncbi:uncharacterized protein LOC110437145 [Sorghum bicolor]|uniref:Uncharacterized protein n=1 Tax=Sorghum bicolor TaxID=4558 RepID=A0A1B6PIS7_SORBI|nr:uncharacterized protein LOC110437145 [Sorghum bicolor]KXG25417.1 hypothetical protein SORBI_3007G173400 [Sorghum bicolor]KXG25495.2 hypothetical protein SORBI_3007G173400 [Sorghum bicolor]|eukprot:XP_021321131.1 uncharacterized protein LOC110437145 [Sorghum bicolor]